MTEVARCIVAQGGGFNELISLTTFSLPEPAADIVSIRNALSFLERHTTCNQPYPATVMIMQKTLYCGWYLGSSIGLRLLTSSTPIRGLIVTLYSKASWAWLE